MDSRACAACGKPLRPRPQRPDQCFCSAAACQRERKRRWQQERVRHDADYRDNQARAQRAWAQRHPGYWRSYRQRNPSYVQANRAKQRERDARAAERSDLAKMDVSTPDCVVPSGTYRLSPVAGAALAKMDLWTVEIRVISTP